jgi:hypothetical protein
MRTGGEITFSDNLCCAYVAAVAQAFQQRHPRGFLGRTAIQKLVYFSKVLGVPIPCSFEIYTYGPYSDAITFCVESLLADEVLSDTSPDPRAFSNYRLGPRADELLARFEAPIAPHRATIELVTEVFGGFRPEELELIATLHFIADRKRRIRGREPTRSGVVREFVQVKGDKFTEAQVNAWYDALKKSGLI